MRLSFLIFALGCCHHVLRLAHADDVAVTRHADGDVFTIPGSCNEACMVLSSNTASPFGSAPTKLAHGGGNANNSCTCQCNRVRPIFREDLRICVDHIHECNMTKFVNGSGLVERVPYVILPISKQIVYPDAEIKIEGVESPLCAINGVQQLGKSGWSELRSISNVEYLQPLLFLTDKGRAFLQWTGEAKLRDAAEGKIVIVKLSCRDNYPEAAYREIFTTCVAFRVAGSPSRSSIKEVFFSAGVPIRQGLSTAEYTAIGIALILIVLIYVTGVSLYLHSRKSRRRRRRKSSADVLSSSASSSSSTDQHPEAGGGSKFGAEGDMTPGIVKCNPLLSVVRHFESDSNSAVSEAELTDKLLQSESESEIENVRLKITSAIIHPHRDYNEPREENCNPGAIIGERLPEEDVRVIETTENGNQHIMPVFPGTQRRKLYFNPAYFERQLLLAPPPAAIEFLLKIREVISIAKHKMAAKRFVPTLNEIPEESSSERLSAAALRTARKRPSSVANGAIGQLASTSNRKSLRCTGCPGCSHGSSTPNLPTARGLAENNGAGVISGESRVRAWLEDVKLLDTRWRNLEEERATAMLTAQRAQKHQHHQKHQQQQYQQLNRLRETRDVDTESTRLSIKSLPPLFRELSHKGPIVSGGCINETFEGEEYPRGPRRTAQSVTREPGYLERRENDEIVEWARRNAHDHAENAANMNVRQAIENSFKRQLELLKSEKPASPGLKNGETRVDKAQHTNKLATLDKPIKHRAKPSGDSRALFDMINSSSDAKRIMDAVIQELVVAKEMERVEKEASSTKASDYETDSLEKSKISRKSSSSPVSTDKSSPALSSALPMDEEMTMRNAIIDVHVAGTSTTSTSVESVVKSHNLPEVVPLRPENYALVSEVYVNDGYASPTGSDDDSGPEIQYEPENPGHLTIKVVDSPQNYIKQDESEYEPDTLDRKPMKLKINGDITYEKEIVNEVYVDSLERSSQIMLRSKRSFKEENGTDTPPKPPREYNSLREIYEARLKYQQLQQQSQQSQETEKDRVDTWRNNNCKCTSPLLPRHQRRQRKADNQPDVVPKPPPPPPPNIEASDRFDSAKNAQDRSLAGAGDPTTCEDAPVVSEAAPIVGKPPVISRKQIIVGGSNENTKDRRAGIKVVINNSDIVRSGSLEALSISKPADEQRSEKRQQYRRFSKWDNTAHSPPRRSRSSEKSRSRHRGSRSRSRSKSRQSPSQSTAAANLEDSAYVSSPDSNCSRRRLITATQPNSRPNSCNSSDESTSGCNGANSESGAESVETDSVFFGNFRACAERERLRQSHQGVMEQLQQRPINYQAFQVKSRVY